MNYKVMKRPMFKLGGKANSQGTGVTSGLDERVDLKEAGFLGTGMSQSDFGKAFCTLSNVSVSKYKSDSALNNSAVPLTP